MVEEKRLMVSDLALPPAEILYDFNPITDLISSERPQRSLEAFSARPACCEEAEASGANTQQDGVQPAQKEHWWLDPQRVEHLPVHIRRGEAGEVGAAAATPVISCLKVFSLSLCQCFVRPVKRRGAPAVCCPT